MGEVRFDAATVVAELPVDGVENALDADEYIVDMVDEVAVLERPGCVGWDIIAGQGGGWTEIVAARVQERDRRITTRGH